MSVSARTAMVRADLDSDPDAVAHRPTMDLRRDRRVRAGTFEWRGPELQSGWHRHPYHQVEYAVEGMSEVETAAGRYLVPPQQAIWIPAGLDHQTTLHNRQSISLMFDPSLVPPVEIRARVVAVPPIVREMLVYGLRWPIDRRPSRHGGGERDGAPGRELDGDRSGRDTGEVFLAALASVIADGLAHEAPLHLPTTADPLVARVLELTEAHLPTITADEVCATVGLSERTLRRRTLDTIGMTWQEYLARSRLLRAAARLAESDDSVLTIATSVGYESQSSFARAFRRWMGDAPSSYRRRMRADATSEPPPRAAAHR